MVSDWKPYLLSQSILQILLGNFLENLQTLAICFLHFLGKITKANTISSLESSHPSRGSPINPSDNTSSPYYLHPSNNPGSLLVSKVFVGDNYIAWSCSITITLTVKIKVAFIDDSISAPPINQRILHTASLRANNLVLAYEFYI